ncbi:MAG: hypothetical protein JW870_16800 [Candidatus Delongbacteria bacterium]|nr:hypothetical protein [Candidatus Delongbacteria bacterium]
MNRKILFSQFNNVPYFTKENLLISAKRHLIPKATLNSYIQRGVAKKELVSLKRNLYTTAHFFNANKSYFSYNYFVGNKLIEPSYISRESALSYYGLLSEGNSLVTTLVTIKATRQFSNDLGIFDYNSIKKELFTGYRIIEKEFSFVIAEPYKAIFDYLYYRLTLKELRNKDTVLKAIDEFRLDIEELEDNQLTKLFDLIKKL